MDFHSAAQMDDATDSDLAASTAELMGFRWEVVMDFSIGCADGW
jgi:hypothetical protein